MNDVVRRLRSPWFLASLAWIGLLLAFFFPIVFQGKVLAPLDILDHLMRPWSDGAGGFGVHNAFVYDAISQYLPYNWCVFQSLRQDGYIGWNPYVYGGYALLENTMLCPGDWHHQLYRFFDFWTAWDLGIVLQFAIAGFGALLMLRGEGLPAWAALVGAVSFAFYSQHVLWIYHRWVLGASCWFPWIVWAVRRARRKNRVFDFWSVAFTALAFRGGSLQSCLFVATLVLCLFLSDWWPQPTRWKPRTILRSALPYATLAVLSSVLISDVLLNTVPPYLEGCRKLPQKSFLKALLALPTLVTALHPTALGTPQAMDGFKAFGCDLFDLKFAGAIPFVLALFAVFRKRAPLLPRILFVLGLAIPFTPLSHWFYSRSTVLFALGCAWLAAWTIANPKEGTTMTSWRRLARLGSALAALWILASAMLLAFIPKIVPKLHRFVENGLSADKSSRLDWMLARSDAFLDGIPIWNPHNLLPVLLVALGLFAAWSVVRAERRTIWKAVLVLCVFGELFSWSRTWISFSERPVVAAGTLYPIPGWAADLRGEMDDAGMLWIHGERPEFDYLQQNAQAGIGIASLQGYETIRPRTLAPPAKAADYNPGAFSERGVSHVLVLPGARPPDGLSNWIECIDSPDLHLFRNPDFDGRWQAILDDGARIPIHDTESSANRRRFELPAGTISVSIAEPFHPGWQDRPPVGVSATACRREDGGTIVTFDRPLVVPAKLERFFRMPNRLLWPQRILLAILALPLRRTLAFPTRHPCRPLFHLSLCHTPRPRRRPLSHLQIQTSFPSRRRRGRSLPRHYRP